MGTIDGNGTMPFPYVTIDEIGIDAWHQLVVVKDREGMHHFITTARACIRRANQPIVAGRSRLWTKTTVNRCVWGCHTAGWRARRGFMAVPLNADEIREDFLASASGSKPALSPRVVDAARDERASRRRDCGSSR